MSNIQVMQDYVKQLKRHTEGRSAVILRLSTLEKQFHETTYRQMMAACLTPLAKNYEGYYFVLPNRDGMVIVKDAHLDVIETTINKVRAGLADSDIIKSLDPVQGVSDDFCLWYFLENDYDRFWQDIQDAIADKKIALPHSTPKAAAPAPTSRPHQEDQPAPLRMNRKTRMVPVTAPKVDVPDKQLNPESLLQLYSALKNADMEGMMKGQWIKAIASGDSPLNVMLHRFVPFESLIKSLVPNMEATPDRLLASYLMTLVEQRVIQSKPDMNNKNAILTSLRVSLSTLNSDVFKSFARSIASKDKKHLVIDLDMQDCMQQPALLITSLNLLEEEGFRTCLSGLDPISFTWLDLESLDVDFIKLTCPDPEADYLYDSEFRKSLRSKVTRMDTARIILDGCVNEGIIRFGQSCGIALFQGSIVSPIE